MILGSLSDCKRYYSLNPSFQKAFEYISNNDLHSLAPGKHEIDENLFVISEKVQGKAKSDAALESHKAFIDIQLCISGIDNMGWKALADCGSVKEHYADKDLTFYEGSPTAFCRVSEGQFAVFFPEDGHAPNIGDGELHKIVFKVRV